VQNSVCSRDGACCRIQSDNTIDSSKIAQARIAYRGRGQITDVQQPRYDHQDGRAVAVLAA